MNKKIESIVEYNRLATRNNVEFTDIKEGNTITYNLVDADNDIFECVTCKKLFTRAAIWEAPFESRIHNPGCDGLQADSDLVKKES